MKGCDMNIYTCRGLNKVFNKFSIFFKKNRRRKKQEKKVRDIKKDILTLVERWKVQEF
jgi:hypothetical protein